MSRGLTMPRGMRDPMRHGCPRLQSYLLPDHAEEIRPQGAERAAVKRKAPSAAAEAGAKPGPRPDDGAAAAAAPAPAPAAHAAPKPKVARRQQERNASSLPKRAMSAYFIFSNDMRTTVMVRRSF
jgi:type IV secretory pathway VirB10-like protein